MSNYILGEENTAYLGKQGLSFSNQFAVDAYGIGYLQGLIFADNNGLNNTKHTIMPIKTITNTDGVEKKVVDLTAVDGGWTLHKDRIEFKKNNSDSIQTRLRISEKGSTTFLAANQLKFSAPNGINTVETASVSFVPGSYGASRTGCFKFSMPFNPNFVLYEITVPPINKYSRLSSFLNFV